MKYVYSLTFILLLSACSSVVNPQSQKITMLTPGASEAKCMIENEDMRYVAYSGQTIEIMHSPNDLTVTCQASGNRERTVIIPSKGATATLGNVVTGIVPGMAYDHFSRSAYYYQKEFVVSFEGMPVRSYPLPNYHNADLLNTNENNSTEYMGPTEIVTEKTRYREARPLDRKLNPYGATPEMPAEEPVSKASTKPSYDPAEEDK